MVYAMTEVKLEVNTTPGGQAPTWKTIAEMLTATMASKNTTEVWTPIGSGGFQSALKTGLGKEVTFDGKRSIGDIGNDFIFSLDNKVGTACLTQLRFTVPQVDAEPNQLVYPCSIDVTGLGGASTAVSTLSFTATSNGEWFWQVEVA